MNTALERSYELERKGLEFYIVSAMKCKNPLARRTLYSLAQEEIQHMMRIDEIISAIDSGREWSRENIVFKAPHIEISIREFFERSASEAMAKDRSNVDVIKKAMELEKKAYDLYAELEKSAGSEIEKSFFIELQKQENEHYAALQNVYYYLTDTGDWFEKEESRAWNWMNV